MYGIKSDMVPPGHVAVPSSPRHEDRSGPTLDRSFFLLRCSEAVRNTWSRSTKIRVLVRLALRCPILPARSLRPLQWPLGDHREDPGHHRMSELRSSQLNGPRPAG